MPPARLHRVKRQRNVPTLLLVAVVFCAAWLFAASHHPGSRSSHSSSVSRSLASSSSSAAAAAAGAAAGAAAAAAAAAASAGGHDRAHPPSDPVKPPPLLATELLKPAADAALHADKAAAAPAKLEFNLEEAAPDFVPGEHAANPRGLDDRAEPDPWKRRQQDTWRLIILFQHNLPILLQAIDGFRRASDIMVPNTIIVDNSQSKEAVAHADLQKLVAEIVPTPRPLNFPELHNYMAELALQRRLPFYFWAHADNYVLAMAPERDMGKDVVDCLREQVAREPNWGMILFSYDHLAAYRTQALIQSPWDPHVFQYGSECDAYGRLRDAGYEAKACKVHYSYDMKRVIGIRDDHTYAETKAMLDKEKEDKRGRNSWREDAMSEKEQQWRQRMKAASRTYLAAKWGELTCKVRGRPCAMPWPCCPKCPDDFPKCFDKAASWSDLDETLKRAKAVFAADSNPPEPLEA